jgi:uncharacterized heparinase superfamily protein
VKATSLRDGSGVLLMLPNREAWLFSAEGLKTTIEESVFLGALEGPRRSEQLVVRTNAATTPDIAWRFTRTERSVRADQSASEPQLF